MPRNNYTDSMREIPSEGGLTEIPRRLPIGGIPTAEQEALQPPPEDLVYQAELHPWITAAITGGASGLFSQMLLDAMSGQSFVPTGWQRGSVGERGELVCHTGETPGAPNEIPDWYKMPNEQRYKVPDTTPLPGYAGGSVPYPELLDPFTGKEDESKIGGYRDARKAARTQEFSGAEEKSVGHGFFSDYYSKIPPIYPVGENPPNPNEMLYHGLFNGYGIPSGACRTNRS